MMGKQGPWDLRVVKGFKSMHENALTVFQRFQESFNQDLCQNTE